MLNKILRIFISFLIVAMPVVSFAEDADLSKIMARLEKLEKENESLKSELGTVKQQLTTYQSKVDAQTATAKAAVTAAPAAAPAAGSVLTKGASALQGPLEVVTSKKMPIQIYGTFFGDMMWQDSNMSEYPTNAPTSTGDNKGNFYMAARGTRMGIDMIGPDVGIGENGKLLGKVEFDFLGAPTTNPDTNTSPVLRLRHAYADLKYPSWDILFGQTWDFFAPLNPPLLNPYILWRCGNIGIRHVQARATKTFKVCDGTLTLQGGGLEADDSSALQIKSQMPVWAGYIAYENEIYGMPYYIGSGGVFGRQEVSSSMTKEVDIWGVTGVFKISPHKMIDVQGECYVGQALAPFMANSTVSTINDNVDGKSVMGNGGWVAVTVKPWDYLKFNGGIGVDNPFTETGNTAIWEYNYSYFCNAMYNLTPNCVLGIEYQRFRTKYWGQNGGDGDRIMTSVIYYF
ncbi:MAG TPA: hypothetical protein PKY78_06475 [Candidatus Omnitrophota bacterium]|nr:hypothetical protein [Candidatus Omnitrophota bacterium]HPS20613.1 hypothetical protein [Candidatus Omnitrophota bacterium]